jgi:hypothetical protein
VLGAATAGEVTDSGYTQARLEVLQEQREEHELHAPFSGIVLRLAKVEAGLTTLRELLHTGILLPGESERVKALDVNQPR